MAVGRPARATRTRPSRSGSNARVAARRERAADELAVEPRRRARDRDHVVVPEQVGRGREEQPRVRVARVVVERVDVAPISTISPAYMTAARVAHLRDDRQVVRDEDHEREPERRRLRPTSSSRICACTITSSAVVGSSASSTRG